MTDIILPEDMTRANTCCFTGHRSIPPEQHTDISFAVQRTIVSLYKTGYRYFLCGGALGFDMLAEQCILKIRQTAADVKLLLALPCQNQTEKWSKSSLSEQIEEYERILSLADGVYCLSDGYYDGCMKKRNLFMVAHSSVCVAYYNGTTYRSGTAQTVRLATRAGIEIRNVYGGSFRNPTPQVIPPTYPI